MGNINITPASIFETIGGEENKKQEEKTLKVNNFDKKNYLDARLEKGQLQKELKIRVLPIDESGKPYKLIHMHTLHTTNKKISDSGFKNYICLKKTDEIDHEKFGHKCPFCELADEAWKKYLDLSKELKAQGLDQASIKKDPQAKAYLDEFKANCASEYAIIRCIDRNHEEEGPKFWKVRVRADKEDAMSKIMALFDNRYKESIEEEYGKEFLDKPREEQEAKFKEDGFDPVNILDVYNGKDLKVTIDAVLDKTGKVMDNKTTVNVIDYGSQKPVSKVESQIDDWVNGKKKWNDVFGTKPYEYLEIVIDGGSPYFSKTENKWVKWDDDFKSNKDKEVEEANDAIEKSKAEVTQQPVSTPTPTNTVNVATQVSGPDDLPF